MILTAEQYPVVLRAQTHSIRLLDTGGEFVANLSPLEAVQLIARGKYLVGGSPARVKYLREIGKNPRPSFVSDAHYWDGRACMRWWADQGTCCGVIV